MAFDEKRGNTISRRLCFDLIQYGKLELILHLEKSYWYNMTMPVALHHRDCRHIRRAKRCVEVHQGIIIATLLKEYIMRGRC